MRTRCTDSERLYGSASAFPLPALAHIPGQRTQPDGQFIQFAEKLAGMPESAILNRSNPAWLYGLRLLDNDFCWEAHEVLEHLWMKAPANSRKRSLIQGVIHLANAGLKTRMNRPAATQRLAALASECFSRAYPPARSSCLMGLHGSSLIQVARACSVDPVGSQQICEGIFYGNCLTESAGNI